MNYITTSEGSCSRVCFEIKKKFRTEDVSYERARLSRSSSFHLLFNLRVSQEDLNLIQLTIINLLIETLINHITIDIVKPAKYDFVSRLDFIFLKLSYSQAMAKKNLQILYNSNTRSSGLLFRAKTRFSFQYLLR
jgi:hypothetical protein